MNHKENRFIKEFQNKLSYTKNNFSNYIFMCIGTDKVIGDSFGPLVGQNLKNILKDYKKNIKVYGTVRRKLNL